KFNISYGTDDSIEIEPNDKFSAAEVIKEGEEKKGAVYGYDYNDKDYYKFTADGSNIKIDFNHIAKDSSGSDFNIFLYNSNEVEMIKYSSEDGVDSEIPTEVKAGETYYLMIEGKQKQEYKFILK
ncbi:MAG: hypothetical protein ACQEP9_05850, partial [Bacillota bacterium]